MSGSRSVQAIAAAAAVVVIAGLVFAYFQRPDSTGSGGPGADSSMRCGSSACQSVVGKPVGADVVELLTGTGGGRIKVSGESGTFIFEMTIAESGAAVGDSSLQCVEAPVSVCLVRGHHAGEVLGEVLVRKNGTWSRVQETFLASAAYLGLHDVDEDGTADIVAAQVACDGQCSNAFVQVISVTGPNIGCTPTAPARDQLPGWPTPAPKMSQLRKCPDA